MSKAGMFTKILLGAVGALLASTAHAQFDYSLYGVADFSYGRFEPSGFEPVHRLNSNSLTASFVGVNASYGLEGGWKPGVTLETFVRFQDFKTGRVDEDPFLSRNAFVSLASNYGTCASAVCRRCCSTRRPASTHSATRWCSRRRCATSSRAATSKGCRATSTGTGASATYRPTGRA